MRALFFSVSLALTASHRGKPSKPERDARDVLRAEDLTRLARDEQSMNSASVDLTKLHADRAHLKEKEVSTLAAHAKATKDTIADAHLIIERLKGQVSAQERELHRQAILISGLQGDLSREGDELLGVGPSQIRPDVPARSAPSSVEKGLERDVVKSGNALLTATEHPETPAVSQEVHSLAARAAQLAEALEQSAQGEQARALAAEAAALDRSLSHGRKGAPEAATPAPVEDRIAPLPPLKEEPVPIGDALAPSALKDDLPPLDDMPLHRLPEPQGPTEYDTGAPLRRLKLKARLPEVPEESMAPAPEAQPQPLKAEDDDSDNADDDAPLPESKDAEVADSTADAVAEADEADDAGP